MGSENSLAGWCADKGLSALGGRGRGGTFTGNVC